MLKAQNGDIDMRRKKKEINQCSKHRDKVDDNNNDFYVW